MLQQSIFVDRNFKQKFSNFSIDDISDLKAKTDIITKYIKALESGRVERTKEEAIQADFLNKFFGDTLGYDYNDSNLWNLEKEYKSITDGTKADGALGFFTMDGKSINADVRAVVELKDALTDLDKPQNRQGDKRTPVEQAFSYSSKAGGRCKWVIVSNFKEIRLYHSSDQSRYENFVLQELSNPDNLKRFFFLLQKERLISKKAESFVDILYRERQEAEQIISKKFYTHYKSLRIQLFENLKQNNPDKNELLLLTKSQKLLDRFIFVCFCEDRNLLPAYTSKKVKDILKNAFDLYPYKLWRQLSGLFQSIAIGNKPLDIEKFNGGLFAKDDDLDNLTIKDDILLKLIEISEYDFDSDLNVNILGHIFEQSLSDIEELKTQIGNGKELSEQEKSEVHKNGKRKKDGIFYTPEYITRYIVKEAIGGWLEDRKIELGFYNLPELTTNDFASIKPETKKGNKLKYNSTVESWLKFWEAYKEQLRNIKILDPACGSGAFLNQAFDYLFAEGRRVNDEISRLRLGQREVFELDRHILTNNIYGVDLNPESVEITKLSLWLKTANRGKELTALDENIKCGNSLIDDPKIAGDKAFSWFISFPPVFPGYRKYVDKEKRIDTVSEPSFNYENPQSKGFEKFGFDVIIGNPPYVFAREKINELEKDYYSNKYLTAQYQVNTYILFIERAFNLLKNNGYFGFIVPNAWLMVSSAMKLREMLLQKARIKEIVNLSGYSFEGVNVETIILNAKKEHAISNVLDIKYSNSFNFEFSHTKKQEDFSKNEGLEFKVFSDDKSDGLCKKLTFNTLNLDEIATVKAGLQAYEVGKGLPIQTIQDVKARPYDYTYKFDENTYPYLDGRDVNRYNIQWSGLYLKYGNNLAAPRTFDLFSSKKIIIREITGVYPKSIIASYSEETFLFNRSNIVVLEKEVKLKYILAILNSNLMSSYFLKNTPKAVRQMFPKIILNDLRRFPIRISDNQKPFIEKVEIMMAQQNELSAISRKFIELLHSKWSTLNITGKLDEWYKLSFEDFRKELEKQKLKLSLQEQAEWLQYFNEQKQKAEAIQTIISQTDNEIDTLVYKLYELTPDEVKIIEES